MKFENLLRHRLLVPALLACAPAGFGWQEEAPTEEPERGLKLNAEGAFQGYTLLSPLLSKSAFLLDMEGQVVHRWDTEYPPGEWAYLLDNGHLLRGTRQDEYPRFHGGGIGGRIQELDWDGNVVWEFVLFDEYQNSHHDFEPLPNGNLLLITWEHRYPEDAIEHGRDPAALGDEGLWPDAVLEIEPTRPEGGKVVWEWHAWDHLIQDHDPEKRYYGPVADHAERIDVNADHRDAAPMTAEELAKQKELEEEMQALGYVGGDEEEDEDDAGPTDDASADWLHTNAIDYNAEYDLIVLSSPRMCEVWVIDHSTTTEEARWQSGGRWGKGGDLLYRFGNPKNYGAGAVADQHLFYQHDAQFVAGERPGELRLLLFNNGGGRPEGDFSSVEELLLPFDPEKGFLREDGAAFGPTEPAWSYSAPDEFFSPFISGTQRLPNGNTLICSGAPGRVFEVTRAGEIVWEYRNLHGGEVTNNPQAGNAPPKALFRATRIAPDHPGLKGRL